MAAGWESDICHSPERVVFSYLWVVKVSSLDLCTDMILNMCLQVSPHKSSGFFLC